jgi:hypothetical protein
VMQLSPFQAIRISSTASLLWNYIQVADFQLHRQHFSSSPHRLPQRYLSDFDLTHARHIEPGLMYTHFILTGPQQHSLSHLCFFPLGFRPCINQRGAGQSYSLILRHLPMAPGSSKVVFIFKYHPLALKGQLSSDRLLASAIGSIH